MFLGSPAWIGLLVLGTLGGRDRRARRISSAPDAGMALFVITLIMWFAPKIATVIDVLLAARDCAARSAAPARFIASTDHRDDLLPDARRRSCGSATRCSSTGLLLGRRIGWSGQARDDHSVPWRDAARSCGRTRCSAGAASSCSPSRVPAAIPYALFIAAGPRAVDPARRHHRRGRRVGRALMRAGIGALPEENAPPAALRSARAAGDRGARRCARPERVRTPCAPRAASSARCASITATAHDAPRWTALYARFVKPRRSRVRCRLACRRPHRGVPPPRRARRRLRAAARAGADAAAALRARRDVTIEPVAVGAAAGEIELQINIDNPTVSTASRDFVAGLARRARLGRPGLGQDASTCR